MSEEFNMFKVLEKDDKELIHSAFVAFLMNDFKEFYKEVLGLDYTIEELSTSKVKTEVSLGKECGRADILVKNPNFTILIENKFKSLPEKEQLDKYTEHFKDKGIAHKYLLTFDEGIYLPPNIKDNWKVISYNQILSFCINLIADSAREGEKHSDWIEMKIFISHYISFLSEYLTIYKKIELHSDLSTLEFHTNPSFWKTLIFHLVRNRIEQKIGFGDYQIEVFHGRQFEPGIRVERKNNKTQPMFKNGVGEWFDIQGNTIRIKFKKDIEFKLEDLEKELKDSGVELDLKNLKSDIRDKWESFTIYYEVFKKNSVDGIAKQFIDFKNKFEDKFLINRIE